MRPFTVFLGLLTIPVAAPLSLRSVTFQWGKTPVKGVNIGGWLVLEPWITPSIFNRFQDVVDEWSLCHNHPDEAPGILKDHWDTWLKKDDLQTIHAAGFNMIRIPIGYWAFQKFNDPYIQGAAAYLDTAIAWARNIGLKVVIDLHGAPLSQNGYDNSGHNGSALWTSGDSVKDTLSVIQQIANKYAKPAFQDVVAGIQLLNEPNPGLLPAQGLAKTVQYYKDAFGDVRVASDTPVVLHDAFQTQGSFWNNVLSSAHDNVIIDHHEYQIFDEESISYSIDQHLQQVCKSAEAFASNVDHWVIVGEWSAALTDCAAGLNGWHVGSRYEGYYKTSKGPTGRKCGNINSDSDWTGPEANQQLRSNTKRYIKAQLDVYLQQTKGFFFWNFKTEQSPEWDLLRLLDWGLFPKLTTYKSTGSVCSS